MPKKPSVNCPERPIKLGKREKGNIIARQLPPRRYSATSFQMPLHFVACGRSSVSLPFSFHGTALQQLAAKEKLCASKKVKEI